MNLNDIFLIIQMKIIVDANILFSALIKDSKTRELIFNKNAEFYTPEFVFDELNKYRKEIMDKSKLCSSEFQKLFLTMFKIVTVIPGEDLINFSDRAYELVKEIDKKDIDYVAAVLKLENSVLWSEDKLLKNIKEIKILNSLEIALLLSKFDESFGRSFVDFFS
jgi:predicted nucleic acid-binding protein